MASGEAEEMTTVATPQPTLAEATTLAAADGVTVQPIPLREVTGVAAAVLKEATGGPPKKRMQALAGDHETSR